MGVFEVLRGIIDDNRQAGLRNGQFLLLGSAALDLMRQSSETLAGRVATIDMAPLSIAEAAAAHIADNARWLRGGFPDSLLAADDGQSLDWRRDFIRSYLERDAPMFAPRLPAETIGRLWTMLAHNQGSVLNQAPMEWQPGQTAGQVAQGVCARQRPAARPAGAAEHARPAGPPGVRPEL